MNDQGVWVERHRPYTLDDVVGQPLIINKLKQVLSTLNFTNLLFAGPNGTGKTTTALIIPRMICGGDNVSGVFKEINASSQKWRSINVVDSFIIPFMRTAPLSANAPFRILLLEEADSLTIDAQKALRRPLEKYNHNCRVIMTVNYPDKIIDAISSRCTRYDFEPIAEDSMINRLKCISMSEEIHFTEHQYKYIAGMVNGDLRKAINIMQNLQVDTNDCTGVFGK